MTERLRFSDGLTAFGLTALQSILQIAGALDVGLIGVDSAWQAALAIDGLLGSPDNITGLGFGYAEPANGALSDEKSLEAFHRFQLSQHTQFSVGAQAIFDPSNAPSKDVVGVFSFRLRVEL